MLDQDIKQEERLSLNAQRDMFYETFRTNLRLLRNYKGMSGTELSKALNHHPKLNGRRVLEMEYGRINPTMEDIIGIANYFKVAVGDLLQREAKVSFVDEIAGIAYVVMTPTAYPHIHVPESKIAERSINDLNLSFRANNCLRDAGIHTIPQLAQTTKAYLSKIANMGAKTLQEIEQALFDNNISLRE